MFWPWKSNGSTDSQAKHSYHGSLAGELSAALGGAIGRGDLRALNCLVRSLYVVKTLQTAEA